MLSLKSNRWVNPNFIPVPKPKIEKIWENQADWKEKKHKRDRETKRQSKINLGAHQTQKSDVGFFLSHLKPLWQFNKMRNPSTKNIYAYLFLTQLMVYFPNKQVAKKLFSLITKHVSNAKIAYKLTLTKKWAYPNMHQPDFTLLSSPQNQAHVIILRYYPTFGQQNHCFYSSSAHITSI